MSNEHDMHPWSFIAEELLARGWTIEDLAFRMAIPDWDERAKEVATNMLALDLYRHVGPTDPRCSIGAKSAKAIGKAFGISEEMILNLERAWKKDQPNV